MGNHCSTNCERKLYLKDFKSYMKKQISEINKYKEIRLKEMPYIDSNQCVFEWIQKNAKTFRDNWAKKINY
ncbi:MAG: hypothetical protein JXB50_03845 [Spirochaetes bacterium]|nr:hypothetical protein [Spirochaetota bacterium]